MQDNKRVVPARRKGKRKKKKLNTALGIVSRILKTIGTVVLSVFLIVIITSCIFATVLTIYVLNFADTTSTVSLDRVAESNISRFVYENPDYDEKDPNSQQYNLYHAIRNNSKHVLWVDIENIPQYTQDCFVYSEDERFYQHDGIDFKRTLGAISSCRSTLEDRVVRRSLSRLSKTSRVTRMPKVSRVSKERYERYSERSTLRE